MGLHLRAIIVLGLAAASASAEGPSSGIPLVDLAGETGRQVLVDREAGQYLGHPTTVLLEDGRTILCVYPKGHGKGAIVSKRSEDGGKTWSARLPTPASWATSLETPTIYRTVDRGGKKRLLLFSGLYPIRLSVSEDDGATWSELRPIGPYGGIVAMASLVALRDGSHLAMFHDDGRFFREGGKADGTFRLYQVRSEDGGLTWGEPRLVFQSAEVHLCEPGLVRSPLRRQRSLHPGGTRRAGSPNGPLRGITSRRTRTPAARCACGAGGRAPPPSAEGRRSRSWPRPAPRCGCRG